MPRDLAPGDTIAALSTPPGQGGIGIVRISGPLAGPIARRVFRPVHPHRDWQSHRLILGRIEDPATGTPVDEVLLSLMKAPHSYTREDVVEINSHSGHALLARILDIVLEAGARPARPGEFTFRAFVNGRIDLTQAEAVMDLIQARSERGVALASRQLGGGLKERVHGIRESVVETLAQTEVSIDYPDEGYGLVTGGTAAERVRAEVLEPLEVICRTRDRGRMWVEGVRIAIVGRVNVGKSSILNRLVGIERAIVNPEPGTTRDIIEQEIHIDGLPVRLLDTAGYRDPEGEVESIGIRLMAECLENADLALWVMDRSRGLETDDRRILDRCKGIPTLAVVNKIDLPSGLSDEDIRATCGDLRIVPVSARTGEGMPELEKAIRAAFLQDEIGEDFGFAPNARQSRVLNEACAHLRRAVDNLAEEAPLEIVALDLQGVLEALDELTGTHTNDEVLNRIFRDFCLGK